MIPTQQFFPYPQKISQINQLLGSLTIFPGKGLLTPETVTGGKFLPMGLFCNSILLFNDAIKTNGHLIIFDSANVSEFRILFRQNSQTKADSGNFTLIPQL